MKSFFFRAVLLMGWVTRLGLLFAAAALWGCCDASFALQPGGPSLLPAEGTSVELAPGGVVRYAVPVPDGEARSVSVLQIRSVVQVACVVAADNPDPEKMQGPAAIRLSNRGGRLASIHLHAVGAVPRPPEGGPASSAARAGSLPGCVPRTDTSQDVTLIVRNPGLRSATFSVRASVPHPITPEDGAAAYADALESEGLQLLNAPTTGADTLERQIALFSEAADMWKRLEEPVGEARTRSLEIYTLAFRANRGDSALTLAPRLAELAELAEPRDKAEAANAYKTVGFCYGKQSRMKEAISFYTTALRLFQDDDDSFNEVTVLENRAKAERILGDDISALNDLQIALPIAQANQDANGELAIEVERGAIASMMGQLGTALEANLRAIEIGSTVNNDYLKALAWSDLGVAQTELHQFDAAQNSFDRATELWTKQQNAYGQMQTDEDRAELLLAKGELGGARKAFSAGVAMSAEQKLDHEHVYFLRGEAVAEMRLGQLTEARAHLLEALALSRSRDIEDVRSGLEANLAEVEARLGHWESAKTLWQQASAAALVKHDQVDNAVALGGLADALAHVGDPTAVARCSEALDALEEVRTGIPDMSLRLSFFASRHDLYDECVQIAVSRGDQEAAFDIAERGRARTLLDEAAASGVLAGTTESLRRRIKENELQLNRLQARGLHSGSFSRDGSTETVSKRIASLLRERDGLRQEAEREGIGGKLEAISLPLTRQVVMRRLEPNEALLAYWIGDRGSYLWVLTSDHIGFYRLAPAAKLRIAIAVYERALLTTSEREGHESVSQVALALRKAQESAYQEGLQVRRLLLPFEMPARVTRLLVEGDGPMLDLSMATLPLGKSTYLTDRFLLMMEPSAAFAWRAPPVRTGQVRIARGFRAVVFADPGPSAAATARSSPELDLPFARQEAQAVAQTFGPRNTALFLGAAASRSNALQLNWGLYDLAHFATHATVSSEHPELSGLMLSPANGTSRPAILSFSDVLGLHAELQMVVLAACESGAGKIVPGEGKLALDNAFLASGGSRVLSTLWPVDDEAADQFMRLFYRHLQRSRSPLLSLQAAQREMARQPQWAAPYFWGAFVLAGDVENIRY